MAAGILKRLTSALLPTSCAACGGSLRSDQAGHLCAPCTAGIQRSMEPWCSVCALPLHGRDVPTGATRCDDCRIGRHFGEARAFGVFEGSLRDLVTRLKYSGDKKLATPLGELLNSAAHEHFTLQEYEALVPVPLHRERLSERGFNQAYLLARPLASAAKIPIVAALDRVVGGKAQVGLVGDVRRANVRDVFAAHPRRKLQVARRNVLLVDDVITSGGTADECARVLLAAGARRVDVVAVARAT